MVVPIQRQSEYYDLADEAAQIDRQADRQALPDEAEVREMLSGKHIQPGLLAE